MLPTYTGAAVYTEKEKFQKVAFGDMDKGKMPYPKNSNDGWVAMLQHYFLSAWLPKNGTPREFYTRKLDGGLYAAGVILPAGTIEPGKSTTVAVPLYAGPQEPNKLAKLAPGLELTVEYGWLTILAVPLFWVRSWFHRWVGNWGVAIILLTVVIKLLFYPLSEASYRSMAKMRVLAPKLQKLKDQYANDRQRLQQAMMELYKTEKINPLGGCLPIVVQIPVFIALYWVLLASVELRHAPFALWIVDLSAPDPWYVLPVLMGATMIIQTRLNPEPPDPVQAKVMKIMPIAFSVFFFFFPAGLVLYWLVNNVLSIAQQWNINRVLGRANVRPSGKG
jgi:YidC/Oxa1 family membrane protein insertase